TTGGASAAADPLLGGPGLKPSAQAAPQGTQPAHAEAVLPLPPINNSAGSTAALAAGMTRPFDKDRDLRIANPDNGTGSEGWARQGTSQGIPTNANGSGAVLGGVVPAGEAGPRQEPSVNPAATSSPVAAANSGLRITSEEQAQELLKARGVIWQRAEQLGDTGEWRFICSVPNRQRPGSRRTHEA